MKKLMVILLSIIMAISFCACSNSHTADDEIEGGQLVCPIEDVTIEDLYEFLAIEKADIDSYKILGVSRIVDEYEIYSIDLKRNDREYNVRFAKLYQNYGDDISGVYLSGDINSAIYDSANADVAPSITVESDSQYSKAYGEWKSFLFSISTSKMKPDDMQKASNEILNAFLGNIAMYK